MIRRDRTATISANSLLSRQFESITDVLLKASQRRNQDLHQRLLIPVPIPPTLGSARKPPVATEPEPSHFSALGDDRIDLERVEQGNKNIVGIQLKMAGSNEESSDVLGTQMHLRGGGVPDYANDPKMMLAELELSSQDHSDRDGGEELDDSYGQEKTRADMKSVSPLTQYTAVEQDNDPTAIPANPDTEEADELSVLTKRLGIDSDESKTFGGIESTADDLDGQVSSEGRTQNEDIDIEALYDKLAIMFPPSCDTASGDIPYKAMDTPIINTILDPREHAAEKDEPEDSPPAAALRLEPGDAESNDIQDGCTQLQSDGIDEQEAKKEKEEMLKRENEKLEATIEYVLEEEKRYRAIEENKRLRTRLIVSNLAADVDDHAIRMFFAKYTRDIRNVTILSVRDPVKRTRTAYVDMYSREVAVRASYEFGGIFGLIVKIKLAVE
ncbi:hypothetical protein ACET3X_008098 [Alternaria dauci]|uniref:RRM domain-containing protein n=1 Tax=Alternaria dauci TaxID=48095 RepID=A0ABR3UBX1_9PLEO